MNTEQRQEIERKVVRHLIRTMKERGWTISRINDGGDPDEDTLDPNETGAMDTIFSVDESTIYFNKKVGTGVGGITRTAFIVLGNDGWDCIADSSCSNHALAYDDFEAVMSEVQAYADKFCE